jgi:hypothetical protein
LSGRLEHSEKLVWAQHAALYRIIARADYIRSLPSDGPYRDGLQDAWGDARSIAMEAMRFGQVGGDDE